MSVRAAQSVLSAPHTRGKRDRCDLLASSPVASHRERIIRMMTMRSPKSGRQMSDSGGGSTPDLRTLEENVTQRKRKYFQCEYDIKTDLTGFKHEIMCFFQDFSKPQNDNCV